MRCLRSGIVCAQIVAGMLWAALPAQAQVAALGSANLDSARLGSATPRSSGSIFSFLTGPSVDDRKRQTRAIMMGTMSGMHPAAAPAPVVAGNGQTRLMTGFPTGR